MPIFGEFQIYICFSLFGTKKNTTGIQFFVNRFSRLYPLHFATLILVTLLQLTNHVFIGSHQIIGNNDAFRFILHILFISGYEGECLTYLYGACRSKYLFILHFFYRLFF